MSDVENPSDPIEVVDHDPGWAAQLPARRHASAPPSGRGSPNRTHRQHGGRRPNGKAGDRYPSWCPVTRGESDHHQGDGVTRVQHISEFEVEMPFRRNFRKTHDGRLTHQVHLVERSNVQWWDQHVAFRDWPRCYPRDRDAYASIKKSWPGRTATIAMPIPTPGLPSSPPSWRWPGPGRPGADHASSQTGRNRQLSTELVGQEVQEQPVDVLGSLELHPVPGTVQPLVAPPARDILDRTSHLPLRQRKVAAAPDPHGRSRHRG